MLGALDGSFGYDAGARSLDLHVFRAQNRHSRENLSSRAGSKEGEFHKKKLKGPGMVPAPSSAGLYL